MNAKIPAPPEVDTEKEQWYAEYLAFIESEQPIELPDKTPEHHYGKL